MHHVPLIERVHSGNALEQKRQQHYAVLLREIRVDASKARDVAAPHVRQCLHPDQEDLRLRVRALHATVLRRAKELAESLDTPDMPAHDPLEDATVLVAGRGRNYPALTIAIHTLLPRYRTVDEVFGKR